MSNKKTAHIVSHTHWDREWYLSYQEFRIKLVKLMDKLLDIFKKEGEYKHFNLDGQTICLQDYLEIRPEKKNELKELVSSGKIAIGPWYVLPDGFLTGSEAIIRNLLMGERIANDFGRKMQIGYLPDTFGHCSQIPQIMSGFDLKAVLIWRGISGEPDKLKSEFIWKSPDQTEILTVHLSDDFGYFNVAKLPEDHKKAYEVLTEAVKERAEFSVCNHVLLMNGFDHYPPQYHTGRVINEVNNLNNETLYIHSSIENYVDAVKSSNLELDRLQGEFISTNMSSRGKVNSVLKNVASSRMYLKQMDFYNDRLLTRYAEPLMIQSFMQTGKYEHSIITNAWKYLLQNHPHDSICGCSVDKVHREMETRYNWVEDIGNACVNSAFEEIANKIDTSCFLGEGSHIIHLFNTLLHQRKESAVKITLELNAEEVFRSIEVFDDRGNKLDSQITNVTESVKSYCNSENVIESKEIKSVKLLVDAGKIEPMGYKTIEIRTSLTPVFYNNNISNAVNTLENAYLKVNINQNGTIDIYEKETKRKLKNIHYFIDGGDIGDEYVYSPPMVDCVVNTLGHCPVISLEKNGPLMSEYKVRYEIDIPDECDEKGYNRNRNYVKNIIESSIILKRDSRIVEFETTIENKAKDHRIRVCLPTGIKTSHVDIDSHFDVVKRPIDVTQPHKNYWIETATGAGAQKRFLSLSDENNGFAILNKGIPEYEVITENNQCIAMLTLLRCVDRIGSNRSMTMGIVPGPQSRTPDAQCIGKYTMKYAIYMHSGSWIDGNVNYEAEKYIVPATFYKGSIHKGCLPTEIGHMGIDNMNISVSTLKKAENRDSVIIRLINLSEKQEEANISTMWRNINAYKLNLKEDRIRELVVDENRIFIEMRPKEIYTIELVHL